MDRYLSRDLEQSRGTITLGEQTKEEERILQRKSRLQKLNPDKTKTADRAKMTDTEIIQNWIEAGESVLLRGPSGIGKTERIKTLYPDLIYMKLTNNMFPEKVVGSVNFQGRIGRFIIFRQCLENNIDLIAIDGEYNKEYREALYKSQTTGSLELLVQVFEKCQKRLDEKLQSYISTIEQELKEVD